MKHCYTSTSLRHCLLTLIALALLAPAATAKVIHLLPRPQKVEIHATESPFALGRQVAVSDPTNSVALTRFLEQTGCTIDAAATAHIVVEMVNEISGAYDHKVNGFRNEGYTLSVNSDEIHIQAVNELGVIRAAQTLEQLAEGWDNAQPAIEALTLTDWPAFKVRGLMHDVGRSFLSIEELKKEIDLLARFKMSVFHWHLTEKLGFRFEVKKYPQLNADANMTRYPGCWYTQEQCRDLEEYAYQRGVMVIPEIDMPGHSDVFTKAMGFSMQTAQGVEALKNILDEVCATFTRAPYIHIGGDEVRITYPRFLETMAAYVRDKGRKVICWNRLVAGAPNQEMCDMTHMWATAGTKVPGLPNIDSRYFYANHHDVYADLAGIYRSNIYYEQQGTPDVAGIITALWNDTKVPTESDIVCSNNMYAMMLATMERAWCGGGKQYYEKGGAWLPASGEEYEEFADWERRFLFHKAHSLQGEPIPYVRQTNVHWRITTPMPNGGSNTRALGPELVKDQEQPLPATYEVDGQTYGTISATGAGFYLRHIWHPTIKGIFDAPANNQTAYAWTYIYSPTAQDVGAQIETYTYSRSGSEVAPPAGQWDRRGSRIWLGGEEIPAPGWKQPGANIPQDDAAKQLTNENFTMRPVVRLHLNAGWNRVFLKLPHVNSGGTGRDKWQFTFVLTDLEGKHEVEGLIYSPTQSLNPEAEALQTLISELRSQLASLVGEGVGFYPTSLATDLEEVLTRVEHILAAAAQPPTAEECQAYADEVNQAWAAFQAKLESATVNQPKVSTAEEVYAYRISTPLRGGRFATGHGAGADVVGEVSPTEASSWMFTQRTDGTYNILCQADGTFLSPIAQTNTAVKCVTSEPENGWTLLPADTRGYFIITSGETQLNQTNNANLGWKIFNWGGGNNTNDTGCQFLLAEVPEPTPAVRPSTEQTIYVYQLSTPLRDNRILTGMGAGGEVVGQANSSDASQWKFVSRTAGEDAYDIICLADNTYLSPDSPNNSALHCVTDQPNTGWQVKDSDTPEYRIIVSGTTQLNQTNAGLGYKVYNWGNGTNISDTGCKYLIELTSVINVAPDPEPEPEPEPDGITSVSTTTHASNAYDLQGRQIATPTRGVYIVGGKKVVR